MVFKKLPSLRPLFSLSGLTILTGPWQPGIETGTDTRNRS